MPRNEAHQRETREERTRRLTRERVQRHRRRKRNLIEAIQSAEVTYFSGAKR